MAALPFHCCCFMLWAIGPCPFGFIECEGMCEDALKLIGCFRVAAERFGPSFIHKPFELSCCKKKTNNIFNQENLLRSWSFWLLSARQGWGC